MPMPMDVAITLDSTTWAALALVLTLIGAGLTWVAWRRRGPAAAIRALAWTLVPVAAWLTGTLRLLASILEAVINWAARLVFSPVVWVGIVVAAVAVALWLLSALMRSRGIGVQPRSERRAERLADQGAPGSQGPRSLTPSEGTAPGPGAGRKQKRRAANGLDDIEDLDDIEAILKRHGL